MGSSEQTIQDGRNIRGLTDGAVEIGREPAHALARRDASDARQPLVIPRAVCAAQLDLEAAQAVAPDPIGWQRLLVIDVQRRSEATRGELAQ